MAHKTFISYKYSEGRGLRDEIVKALGDDAQYYLGETSASPDLTDTTTDNIKKNLRDMIYGTTVTIVIISPNMTKSKWIDWEIEYSLKATTRKDRTSRTNGVVGVIMEHQDGYNWIASRKTSKDGCSFRIINDDKLYDIIETNRFNMKNPVYSCKTCQIVDWLTGSYISLIEQNNFLKNPSKYIDNAVEKSEVIHNYTVTRTI